MPGAGLDQIDFDVLAPDTMVSNVFEHDTPIAEFVLARLLEWEIRAEGLQNSFSPMAWPSQYRGRVPHGEGPERRWPWSATAASAEPSPPGRQRFGVEVVAVDDNARSDGSARVLPTSRLPNCSSAPILVLACPLTPATTGLIDTAALARMPAHSVLVNISRAPIVDERALYEALQTNVIGGAILDVWYRYPGADERDVAPADVPLWELPNAWCTPHSSAWTTALPRRRYAVIGENINRLVAGEPLRNLVCHVGGDSSRRSSP